MRAVSRPAMPTSLAENGEQWTKELIDALTASEKDNNRIRTCFNRYRTRDVRKALEEMYKELCCYCESKVGAASYSHIEHRKPKSEFPELTFSWDNLHLACQICNQSKGPKWCISSPILDSVHDCISSHLSYRKGILGPYRWHLSLRGKTTVEHAKLNRPKLVAARAAVMRKSQNILRLATSMADGNSAERIRSLLQDEAAGNYGSVVVWLMKQDSNA